MMKHDGYLDGACLCLMILASVHLRSTVIYFTNIFMQINEYPWMVALTSSLDPKDHFCGGTLVASRYVVTAAHCVAAFSSPSAVWVRVGDHDLATTGETGVERTVAVSRIIVHPGYDDTTKDNDVALLHLAEHLDLATYTPACIAESGETFAGDTATVYGWGTVEYGGDRAHKLLEVDVDVVTNEECGAAMHHITESMLCAGGQEGEDACQVSSIVNQLKLSIL